jgi:hypothetical protein
MEKLARYRVPLVLGVLVAALGAYIALHERHTLTSGELESRRGRLLERFVRARCDRIEIERLAARADGATRGSGGAGDEGAAANVERIVLVREREDSSAGSGFGAEFDIGTWRLLSPVSAPADEDAVSALLGALEWLDARRTFEAGTVSTDDERRMGLASPRVRVTLTVARERTTLVLGAPDARGEGVYLRVGASGAPVHVVGKDFFEAVDHDAAHFRSKRVLDGAQSPRLADRITLRTPGRDEVRLRREVNRWHFEAGAVGWASREAVDAITRALDELRAERFVAERIGGASDADLRAYGLDAPTVDLELEVPPPVGRDGGPRTGFRLRVGGPCRPSGAATTGGQAGAADVGAGQGPGENAAPPDVYVLAGEQGPVVCVRAEAVRALSPEPDALRERRLLVAEDNVIEQITFRAGDRVLVVRREGDGWKRSGVGGEGDADPDAVARLLAALRAVEPVAYAPAPDEASLRGRGLQPPRASLVVDRGEDLGPETLVLGDITGDTCFVRRADEPVALRVPANVAELLEPSALRVRGLRVLSEDDATATELRIVQRARPEERIVRVGGSFRVVAPVVERAGLGRTASALRAFASLRAERWVAERAEPHHGLDPPRATVTVRFAPDGEASGASGRVPHERTLFLGSATAGGAYARVDGEAAVFVVPEATVTELLGRPYVAADVAACDRDHIERIEVDRMAGPSARESPAEGAAPAGSVRPRLAGPARGAPVRFVVTRAGEGFTASGPGAPDVAGAAAIADAIAGLLAQPRAYAAPAARAPAATVRVTCGGAQPRRYAFTLEPRGDSTVSVRLSESGVELEAHARDVAVLLGTVAAAQAGDSTASEASRAEIRSAGPDAGRD